MRNKTFFIVVLAAMLLVTACADTAIDRHALVMRNNPHVTKIDSLHSLTVGNGRFAFTADALATAFMVMGLEEAEAFCKADTTIDAYFIYSGENGEFKTFYTEGMKKYIAK